MVVRINEALSRCSSTVVSVGCVVDVTGEGGEGGRDRVCDNRGKRSSEAKPPTRQPTISPLAATTQTLFDTGRKGLLGVG